jgi:hypothetical protein
VWDKTTMFRCALCEAEFDTENESAEHLIPNAIGGRRKVMRFICRECNSSAGETWDAEVARQLLWLSLMVSVSRERGQLPSLKVITTADERLTIRSDGSLYQISQSVTLWLFPNRQRSDSTWRTREFRHDRCSASERF